MLLKKVKACAETLKTTLLPDTRWTKCLVGGQEMLRRPAAGQAGTPAGMPWSP